MITGILCLALNVYHEARGEPEIGQMAVAHVTLNRLDRYDSLCDVVYAPHQFSWQPTPIYEPEAYAKALSVAVSAHWTPDPTGGATHFYAHNKVTPYWADLLEPRIVIGNHTFMKE